MRIVGTHCGFHATSAATKFYAARILELHLLLFFLPGSFTSLHSTLAIAAACTPGGKNTPVPVPAGLPEFTRPACITGYRIEVTGSKTIGGCAVRLSHLHLQAYWPSKE
jgi:hypothetical protein